MPLSVQVMKRSFLTRIIVVPCCLLLLFATFTPVAMADVKAQTTIEHNPPGYFVPEYRIQMDARVKDPSGVELVRCYFRAAGEADFVFVPMTPTGGNSYSGILPAPSSATKQIEYLFLSVNEENVIVKTQAYVINGEERDEAPSWQDIAQDDEIRVSMELDEVPSELPGFSDNIVMDQVESGLRFGVVAGGLYQVSSSTSGSAAAASSAGTVSAGTGGIGTAGAVAIGVGAAAAVGGAAAVAGGSSDGGGGSSNGNTIDDDTKAIDLVGNYYVTEKNTSESIWHADVTLSSGGNVYFTEYTYGDPMSGGSGSWSYTASTRYLSMQVAGSEGSMSGSISGNVKDFWISGTWGDGSPAYFRAIRR